MIIFKKHKSTSKKKSSPFKKYPRKYIDKICLTDDKANKIAQYCKNNWLEDNSAVMYYDTFKQLKRFLLNNVGNNVNDVYDDFISRCDKSVKDYDLKTIFYHYFACCRNLYLDGNIIKWKYLKPKFKYDNSARKTKVNYNIIKINQKTSRIIKAYNKVINNQEPVFIYIGRFYIKGYEELQSVYLTNAITGFKEILGVGRSVKLIQEGLLQYNFKYDNVYFALKDNIYE